MLVSLYAAALNVEERHYLKAPILGQTLFIGVNDFGFASIRWDFTGIVALPVAKLSLYQLLSYRNHRFS